MSRVRQEIASVIFQADARKANASMEALQEKANSLNDAITGVKQQIEALGNVAPDHQGLISYQQQLRKLNSDLKDVRKTMSDYMRGVKAADQLWQSYTRGDIEGLSLKAIKAGQNGLRKRMENLSPGNPDDQKTLRAYEEVIKEADLVVNKFKTDAAETIQILRDGGTVSEQAMKKARDGVKSLMETVEEGTQEYREFSQQYEYLAAKTIEFTEAQRRAKGEIVDANDARRAAVRLTREGAEAAAREREAQDAVITAQQKEIEQTRALRLEKEKEIEQTNSQMATNMRLADAAMAERRQMEDDYQASLGAIAAEKRQQAQQQAQAAHDEADQMRANAQLAEQTAQQKRQAYEQETQTVTQLDGEVKQLTEDLQKMAETNEKLTAAQQQGTQSTDELTEAQNRYNDAVEKRKAAEQALKEVQNRSYMDDPEIKRLDAEIAKIEELIAVSDKYKKQFAKMSDTKFESGYMGDDSEVRKALHVDSDPRKSIWGAADYLKGAYHDRSRASLADFVKDKYSDEGTAAEYQKSAERVAKGIVQNAQENFRRAIFKEIQDGNWTSEAMEQQLDIFRSQFQNEFRNARPGQLKDDPEYHYYKYVIEQMEKYLEVAKQVEAERAKIAGGEGYLELARSKDDIDQPHKGLLWQKEEREWNQATIKTEDIDRRRKDDERVATDKVTEAKNKERIAEENLTEAKRKSAEATDASATTSDELQRKQAELTAKTEELAQAKQRQAKAEGEMNAAQQQANKAQDDANQKQVEAVQLSEKAAQAEREAATEQERHNEVLQRQDEKIAKLQNDYDALDDTLRKQEGELAAYDETITKSEQNIAEAERKKAQARELSAKDMRDAIAALRERNDAIGEANPEWAKNEHLIGQYNQRLEEMKQLSQELRGEVMSLNDALGMAGTIDGGGASVEKMEQAIKTLTEAKRKATDQKDFDEYGAAIDKISQKLKEATSEWMSLSRAEEIARQAGENYYLSEGKSGFVASPEEIQKATQALERQREAVIKNIQQKKANKNATDEEKKALADEEKKLQDLTKKLRDLKFEQDNVNMSQEKMRRLMEQPAQAVSLDELRAAIKRADGELRRMEGSLGKNSKEYKAFAEQVKAAKNTLKDMEGAAKASATAWEKAWSRLKTYVGLYMGFNIMWQKVTGAASDLMDLSDRMGEVRKTTGFTADEVGRLSENLKKMDVRTPLQELMSISASAGQLGLKSLEDVQGFTEAANKLMIALPEMGREAATEMMRVAIATGEVDKIRKQLQEGTIEGSSATAVAMEKIASTIDRLRASSASTAPEITDFVKRVGAVGAQSGITIDQVAALGSTVSSLGMRVEMSATALSRMIPAIRRNAFDVAHAIGMAPEALRKMFDEAGGGMNAMLEIFQHIKDAGMDEDDIEKMLGMGDMAEIMKELNQQGARAGIVFAGLSQNVDELRRQLGVANQAYDENIAIQQEFDKMNETTAAKWERLKNAFEEMFVGDEAQRGLGVLIDGLRKAVDLINDLQGYIMRIAAAFALWKTGVGGAIWTYLINPIRLALTGVHSLNFQVKGLAATWRTAWKSMDAATKTNWIVALGSAIFMLGKYIYDTATRISELQQELNRLDIETDDAVSHVGRLVTAFNDSSVKAEAAAKKQADLQAQTDRLSKEVDKLKKSTDEGTASTDELKRKQAELEEKEKELKKATDESNKANQARSNLISEMNSKYSTYLGYMLNEKTAAEQVASAHQLIIAALKEERKQKGLNALHDAVDKEYADDIKEYSENSQEELSGIARDAQRRIMDQWRRVLTAVTPDAKTGNFTLAAVDGVTKGGTYGSEAELKAAMRSALRDIVRTEAGGKNDRVKVSTWAGTKYKSLDDYLDDIWGGGTDDGFGNWAETYINRERDIAKATHDNQVEVNQAHKERIEAAVKDQRTNLEDLQKLAKDNNQFTDDQIRQMAQDVNALVAGFDHFGEELSGADEIFGKGQERTLQNAVNNVLASLDQKTRARVFRVAQKGQKSTNGTSSVPVPSGSNAWGSNAPADSTDYSLFDVNELVARRNQMDKFKNILKPDTDVRTVLAEDKALMKALDNGLKSDWKSVLDWYNAERKKIQEELKSERFSTNTGHWRDEKNGRVRKNRFRESDYALAELDRYYSRRKEKLEKAREEEGMSEELFNREAELLEQEHLERRSKLRETFTAGTSKQEREMVAQFRLWWDKLEKSGDLDEVPWATVESEWAKALASEIGRNNLKAQQDLTQLQSITVKHLNQIAKLIDQERPYDGITANLRKNLTEMDILLADMVKDGPAEDTAKLVSEQGKRLQFLLTEAEHAYALTFDDLQKKMREHGLGDWADALMIDEQKKQSLMQNLRNVYDQIQEAIKKEASIIKKQLEIQWNDMLPGQDMSMKGTFEKAISYLGLAGDQVKRANSLIGAGAASERVADRLAIQQMKVQLAMQQTYFALMQKIGDERVRQLRLSAEANDRDAKALKAKAEQLRKEGKITEAETKEREAEIAARQALQDSFDAEHAQKSLNLAKTKEIAEEEKQRVAIQNQLEESQNRLYTELRSWADLLTSSIQGVFEASHAGDAEYYNERAKLNLTGKGGPGAGTYIVIDDAGTSDATAHYEYLDERQALEREHEIERENAMAEAWEKLWDDINMKMSDQITDWVNAYFQSQSIDANTQAVLANTQAIYASMGQSAGTGEGITRNAEGFAVDQNGQVISPIQPTEQPEGTPSWKPAWQMTDEEKEKGKENLTDMFGFYRDIHVQTEAEKAELLAGIPGYQPSPVTITEDQIETVGEKQEMLAQKQIDADKRVTDAKIANKQKEGQVSTQTDKTIAASNQSTIAKMIAATNLYGAAYQAMSNDNLDMAQKFQMIALQAVGNVAMVGLQVALTEAFGKTAVNEATALSKDNAENGSILGPILWAIGSALVGSLMGLAASKIASSKSQIASMTGASVGAGRLTTGMLTYAEGNVNEFTDPASLTPGRQYNVDGADGRTYRARYMGSNPRTHITNGPEFHLVGEKGREAIIDAHTTRLMQTDDTGIWQAIQTLYNGGRVSGFSTRRGRGVRAFAEGNINDFEEMGGGYDIATDSGGDMSTEQVASLQASLDRNSDVQEALLKRLQRPLTVAGTGSDGVVAMYDKLKKEAQRHGVKYI